jgi:hypothetical protein
MDLRLDGRSRAEESRGMHAMAAESSNFVDVFMSEIPDIFAHFR